MVEFYASIGSTDGTVATVADRVDRIENTISTPLSVGVQTDVHWLDSTSTETITVLVAGMVFSIRDDDGNYRSVVEQPTADVVLDRYRERGADALGALNGEFVVLVWDADRDETTVVTDRIGALPCFWTDTGDSVRITTNTQLFAADDSVELAFDLDYLTEYFVFQRTFGIHTPLEGVEKLPPGSMFVFDADGKLLRDETYWEPVYAPSTRNYEYFVDEFADRISTVMDERSRVPGRRSLLLSGGSDSRLLAHLIDDATAYHLNDRENREVRVARRIAAHTGLPFEFLQREQDYYLDVLEADSKYDNFISWFYEAHSIGFESQLSDSNLYTGLYSDMLFHGYYLPKTQVTIPVWNKTISLPRLDKMSPELLNDHRLSTMSYGPAPGYLRHDRSIDEILRDNYRMEADAVIDHGIRYQSVEPLYFSYYPLSNDYSRDYNGTLRIGPRWTPFLDDRMIDLQLQYPLEYMLERNLVNDVIERFDPELLAIPHGESGVRLDRPRLVHELAIQLRSKLQRIRKAVGAWDAGYTTSGSWQDHQYVFQNEQRFDDYMYSSDVQDRIEGLEFVDTSEMYERYESDGTFLDFYPLITLLEMPVTKSIART